MKELKPFISAGKIECPKCLNGYMELKYCIEPDGAMPDGRKEHIKVICGAYVVMFGIWRQLIVRRNNEGSV